MDTEKKFKILADIHRASHFEWRRTVLELYPDTEPTELVKRYWEKVGKDTAKYYLGRIDPRRDLARQVAELIVASSVAMGEDAEVLDESPDVSASVCHHDCPWYHWHKHEGLLEEDQIGCDHWLKTVVDEINLRLGTLLRFKTLEALPAGGECCQRIFWEEKPK